MITDPLAPLWPPCQKLSMGLRNSATINNYGNLVINSLYSLEKIISQFDCQIHENQCSILMKAKSVLI